LDYENLHSVGRDLRVAQRWRIFYGGRRHNTSFCLVNKGGSVFSVP
jgi:hypothetical protein